MFRKVFALFLSMLLIIGGVTNCYASSGADIIYDILNKDSEENNTCTSIIYNIINGEKETKKEIKLVKYDQFKKEKITSSPQHSFNLDIKNRSNNDDDYILGLDISKHNGSINWNAIKKANIKFVIIRAGYGTTPNTDIMFKRNIEEAIENDMIIGVYWFSYSYTSDMEYREAKACLETINKYKEHINLPVFYDFEYDSINYAHKMGASISGHKVNELARIFCDTIKKEGYEVGIYTNLDYASNYFSRDTLDKYHTWIASWTNACYYKYNYIMWQCSDSKWINGKRFDLNKLYYNRFEKMINNEKN
jgi:GH25 family lysozyme M1 (1,4-beta-N-acetylmuramidase)